MLNLGLRARDFDDEVALPLQKLAGQRGWAIDTESVRKGIIRRYKGVLRSRGVIVRQGVAYWTPPPGLEIKFETERRCRNYIVCPRISLCTVAKGKPRLAAVVKAIRARFDASCRILVEHGRSGFGETDLFILLLDEDETYSEVALDIARAASAQAGAANGPWTLPDGPAFESVAVIVDPGDPPATLMEPLVTLVRGNVIYVSDLNDTELLFDRLNDILRGHLRLHTATETDADFTSNQEPSTTLSRPLPAATIWSEFERPGRVMLPDSTWYVTRKEDKVAWATLDGDSVTISIIGAPQTGKSSLLQRLCTEATRLGWRTAYHGLGLLGRDLLGDADTFYLLLARWLSRGFGITDQTHRFWQKGDINSLRCTNYVEGHILEELDRLDKNALFALDEVDGVLTSSFRDEFFQMLRGWHERRAKNRAWCRLGFVLATSTEPSLLIENLRMSPFNVGEAIFLQDFTSDEVRELADRHSLQLDRKTRADLFAFTGGHPYLTRLVLFLAATGIPSLSQILDSEHATQEGSPFSDHLCALAIRLDNAGLVDAMRKVITEHRCPNDSSFYRLKGAGLIVRDDTGRVVPRCGLYSHFFARGIPRWVRIHGGPR